MAPAPHPALTRWTGSAPARLARTSAADLLGAIPPDGRRIVYNSFQGRYSDNPRAIFEELSRRVPGLTHVWTARPGHSGAFPPHTRPVAQGTWRHELEVQRARYVVANVEMREHLRRRKDVTFLQTWHGTPLKRVGYDNRYVVANPAGFERDVREYARWDYLLSPNPFSTAILAEAFRGFDGEILELGYPRNDALNAPDRDAVRARVRAQLGIEEGQTVVLYAPTWRDDAVHERNSEGFALALDTSEFARRMGDDHVLLLRLHFLVSAQLPAQGPAVRDVSAHEDVRELYLAADVLVTDYSSVMFDFAITGKPLVYYAYDLAYYRDELRGFYFDLEPEAPGPICRTTGEVLDALSDLDGVRREFAGRYRAFRERYNPLDDGQASRRVVERVFGDLLG
jgi:CDP-glycerol glycerophosphotransferase